MALGVGQAGFDFGEFGCQSRDALFLIGRGCVELMAAGGQISQCPRQFGKRLFRSGQSRVRHRDAFADAANSFGAGLRLLCQRLFFSRQTLQCGRRITGERALTLKVCGKLLEPVVEFANPLLGAQFLALEPVPGDRETL